MKKTIYLGIDQTGAVNRLGKPNPLASCSISGDRVDFFYLDTFSKDCIFQTLNLKPSQKIVVCLDCVLGLPQELDLTWRRALDLIKSFEGFGREPARNFFRKLGGGQVLSRKVEIKSRANSVFKELPFQKNIQTGTYRIWKDLANSTLDFVVPFLNEPIGPGQIPLYEGYPSLSWKLLFGLRFRAPDRLPILMKQHFPELVVPSQKLKMLSLDKDLADAFVLALSLKKLKRVSHQEKSYGNEGWILGQGQN